MSDKDKKQGQTEPSREDAASKRPVIQKRVQGVKRKDASDKRSAQPESSKDFARRLISAEWCQVLVNTVLAIIAVCALLVYKAQLDEMRRSTDAATKAADAAKAAVNQATAATHLEQRAWISVALIEGIPQRDSELQVTVHWKNTGKTFAKHSHLMAKMEVISRDDPTPDYDIEKWATFDPPHIGTVAPDSATDTILGVKEHLRIAEDQMNNLRSGEKVLIVRGKATYDDIFGCHHWTTFCQRLNPGNWKYEDCEIGNDADDNACP